VKAISSRRPAKIEIVGLFPDYASAERAWRTRAQATVDSAEMRDFMVHRASIP
jgi:hypothetical protein